MTIKEKNQYLLTTGSLAKTKAGNTNDKYPKFIINEFI